MDTEEHQTSNQRWEEGDLAQNPVTNCAYRLLGDRTVQTLAFGERKEWLLVCVKAPGQTGQEHWADAEYLDRCFERVPSDQVDLGFDDPLVRAFADLSPDRRLAVLDQLTSADPTTFDLLLEGVRRHKAEGA